MIIGVGFAQGDAIATAAKTFPDKKFVIIDVDQSGLKGKPTNVVGMLFREEQVGYLAGYLAALEAKRSRGPQVISSGRRVQGAAGRPLHRGLPGGREGGGAGHQDAERLLVGLGRPGEVKELALNQIPGRLEGRLPGRGRLRARRTRRGA